MSDPVQAEITIKAPPEEVWAAMLDPNRLDEWVTIHKKLLSADEGEPRKGMRMKQCLALRGASFKVDWELTECDPHEHAVWQGKGPVRSNARTEYRLAPDGDGGTKFTYINEFKAPGGLLGKTASSVLVGGLPKREAEKSLQQLKQLLEK